MTDSLLLVPEIEDDDQEVDLVHLLLEVLSGDGTTIGNLSSLEALNRAAARQVSEEEY